MSIFHPHGIWGPGVRLMRNLRFASKSLLISLMFLIPLGLSSYFFTSNQIEQITFNVKERAGVEALKNFYPIYLGIIKTRNATRATLGRLDRSAQYTAAREITDQKLKLFDQYLNDSGDILMMRPSFEKLKAAWANTAAAKNGVDSTGRTVFGPVTESISSIMMEIGENSNLVLDPELDSFYLMNTLVLTLPKVADDLGQLWGWSTFALAQSQIAGKELSANDARRYAVWSNSVQIGLKDSNAYLQRSFKANPSLSNQLDLSILTDTAKFQTEVDDIQKIIENESIKPEQLYERGESAVTKLLSFYDKGLPLLDSILKSRLDSMHRQLFVLLVSIVITLFLAGYFFYSFFLVTRGGLRLISLHLGEMAEGDLRKPPSLPWGSDEPAQVIIDLRKAYDSLHLLIMKVTHSSNELHSASDTISAASMDLSSRTEQAAASLEEQAAAMEEMAATVSETADRAAMAAQFSANNSDVAEKGGAVISQVVSTMRDIQASSAKISDIIGVIDGIAFQTNILALNAAVEAARAGEQGRGFAVVASEVRSLAGRSAAAAKEIKDLISHSVQKVESGTQIVETAGKAMTDVVSNAKQINTYLNEIALAAREEASSVEQVGQAINELDKNTQQNASLVEETAAAAAALRDQADTLCNEIANFKV
ncbi:MAG: hypothetical protein K2Q11_00270 [Burkholderiaceae bacterium]|nr:hypothetical protein [Burkholderiaceae bacterium]